MTSTIKILTKAQAIAALAGGKVKPLRGALPDLGTTQVRNPAPNGAMAGFNAGHAAREAMEIEMELAARADRVRHRLT